MKLSELLIDGLLPSGFNASAYALVFEITVKQELSAAQAIESQYRIEPIETTDGRWIVGSDVLTEALTGLFAYIFQQLPVSLAEQVDVIPWEDARALLPEPEPLELET